MATEKFTNNATTTLNGDIDGVVTSIVVISASLFPSTAQFRILIESELMLVTAGAGTTTWTVTRGIESTTAVAHTSGKTISLVLTEGAMNQIIADNFGSDVYANLPASEKAGKLFFATDNKLIYRDNGSLWVPYGFLQGPLTPFVDTGFSWTNQGTASLSVSGGLAEMTVPANVTGNIRIREKAVPAADAAYTITAFMSKDAYPANYCYSGLCLRDSVNGPVITWGTPYNNSAGSLEGITVSHWNSPTAFGSELTTVNKSPTENGIWLKLNYDGAGNYTFYFSKDGRNFVQYYTNTKVALFGGGNTATHLGWFGHADQGAGIPNPLIQLWSWTQT